MKQPVRSYDDDDASMSVDDCQEWVDSAPYGMDDSHSSLSIAFLAEERSAPGRSPSRSMSRRGGMSCSDLLSSVAMAATAYKDPSWSHDQGLGDEEEPPSFAPPSRKRSWSPRESEASVEESLCGQPRAVDNSMLRRRRTETWGYEGDHQRVSIASFASAVQYGNIPSSPL